MKTAEEPSCLRQVMLTPAVHVRRISPLRTERDSRAGAHTPIFILKDLSKFPLPTNFIYFSTHCGVNPAYTLYFLCCHGYAIPMATAGLCGWPPAPTAEDSVNLSLHIPFTQTHHTSSAYFLAHTLSSSFALSLHLSRHLSPPISPLSLTPL